MTLCPGRDTRVSGGDEVTLIGTPAELRTAAVVNHPERTVGVCHDPHAPSAHGRATHLRDLAVSLARAADRRLAIALGALLAVLIAATLVLRFTYHLRGSRPPDLAARRGVLHRRDRDDRGLRRLHLPRRAAVADRVRDLPHAGRRAVRGGLLRAGHQHAGQPADRGVARAGRRSPRCAATCWSSASARSGLRVAQELHDAGSEVVVIEKDEHNRHLGQVRALGVPVMIADATLPEVLRVGPAGRRVRRRGADQRRPRQPGDRPGGPRPARGRAGESTPVVLRIFDPQLAHSVKDTFGFQATSGRPPRSPRRGSSARRSASTCCPRSTRATSRCSWPG